MKGSDAAPAYVATPEAIVCKWGNSFLLNHNKLNIAHSNQKRLF